VPESPQLTLDVLAAARRDVGSAAWLALDHREQLFVAAYLATPDLNASEAARMSGHPPRSAKQRAHEIMERPQVKTAIADAMNARTKRTMVDADYVVTKAVEATEGAQTDREWSAMNGSLTLLARHLGMLTDKLKVDFRDVSTLSDEELEAEAKALGLRS